LRRAAIGVIIKSKSNMDEKLKDQDVLLVKEKGGTELHAVNLDKNGKVKSSKLDGSENPDFLKIDKNGNVLENFFENFKRQIKDPTRFDFYRAPLNKLEETVKRLYEAFKSPNKPENKDFLDAHRINPENVLKKQAKEKGQTERQTKSYAINPDLVDWQKFERFGIARENLEKSGNLDKLLDYQKTKTLNLLRFGKSRRIPKNRAFRFLLSARKNMITKTWQTQFFKSCRKIHCKYIVLKRKRLIKSRPCCMI
jgi:hypothetical protein